MNGTCWSLLRNLGVTLNSTRKVSCTVANGQTCPPSMMLLGADFLKILGVAPNLRNYEWCFSSKPIEIAGVNTSLDEDQSRRMQEMVNRNMKLMGSTLGIFNVIEHEIIVDGPPVKQRYYPVSPVLQKHNNWMICWNKELWRKRLLFWSKRRMLPTDFLYIIVKSTRQQETIVLLCNM